MSMKIDSSLPSFYNAGRVDEINRGQRVEPVQKIRPVEEAKGISSLTEQQKTLDLSRGNQGIIRTQVSPENSYQKALVTDRSFAFERMAGKLMDKLPNILKDIQNLPEDTAFAEAVAEKKAAPSKVIISEDGRIRGQQPEPPETENITL
ncbi:MAG: hypothetical protein K5668_07850 [Lachnospiraceae bacterium]|nr:hypothetical protein [Lachnospiraceae bacterium]